ncbi:glucosamine-6-phosphate deaminase [Nonomuraea sp. 3N208]|uniref:glucosamine-6-phosphate deaminase n=1 Tax=Nonomuraea sp. 3N208 TaxID=3457421 RepID=UPI003FD3FE17
MIHSTSAGRLTVRVYRDRADAGAAAASAAAQALRDVLDRQNHARVAFAAAPSQLEMLTGLRAAPDIDWSRVVAFHLDEYVGLPREAPQRFDKFLRREIWDSVRPGQTHAIDPDGDPQAACARYAELLEAGPLDLICLGIGDNGHLAFNDPPVADFDDPLHVKVVELDDACRKQQVTDGCFATLDEVPTRAVTLTLPTLLSGKRLIVTVPGAAKHKALRATLEGPVSVDCPASALREHTASTLFADAAAYGDTHEDPRR